MTMKQANLGLTFLFCLALVSGAHAGTLEGTIVNGTTGGAGTADLVELVDVAQGMGSIAQLEDVSGSFSIADVPTETSAHLLLRVHYDGVVYSSSVSDTEGPLEVKVYERTDSLDGVVLGRHHVLFQRDGDHLLVTELLEYANRTDPPMTIAAEAVPMRLELANPVHGQITASVGSGQMPVTMDLVPTDTPEIQGVEEALTPGTTRMIVRYNFEYHEGQATWNNTAVYPTEDRRILVAPTDVQVMVDQMIETESPLEGFKSWSGLAIAAGESWSVRLAGGSNVSQDHDHGPQGADQVASVVVRSNRLSDSGIFLMLGLGALLTFGLLLGLSRSRLPEVAEAGRAPAVDEKRRRISRLADRYISGEITREQFEADRDAILGGKGAHRKNGASKRVETASR